MKSYEELRAAYSRILNNAFNRSGDRMRAQIPARPEQDDDLVIGAALQELRDLRANGEAETVKRIVAWLRAEGARRWMAGDDDAERVYGGIADAIERGEWRK